MMTKTGTVKQTKPIKGLTEEELLEFEKKASKEKIKCSENTPQLKQK